MLSSGKTSDNKEADNKPPVNVVIHYHKKEETPQVSSIPQEPSPNTQKESPRKKSHKKSRKSRRVASYEDEDNVDYDEEIGGKVVHIHHHHYYNTPAPQTIAQQGGQGSSTQSQPIVGQGQGHNSQQSQVNISDTVQTKMGLAALSRRQK